MKDLKHYFTDTQQVCEASNSSDAREVTNEPANTITGDEDAKGNSSTTTTKKRGRVKIKISQNKARGKVCDIVESKNDLIDKTPSPFTLRDSKSNDLSHDDTPKRSTSLPRKSTKGGQTKAVSRKAPPCSNGKDENPGDENDNLVSNTEQTKRDEPAACINGKAILVDNTVPACADINIVEREESNAFQVLMTRKKAIQYMIPAALTAQEEELAAKIVEESKIKLKNNKEKLITLADRKGYTKRKLGEIEEAEKIEKRLEKRAKVFKQSGKKESEDKKSPLSNKRVSPGSLHNYFSKISPEEKLTPINTTDIQDVNIVPRDSEKFSKIAEPVVVPDKLQSSQPRNKKPRWSLRINLRCTDDEASADSDTKTNDVISSTRSDSKPKKTKVRVKNSEEGEGSGSEVSSVKSKKKRKLSMIEKKNKTTPIAEKKIADPQSNVIIDKVMEKKIEAVKSQELEIMDVKAVKRQPAEKLAPLFVKRPKPDPAVLEARRLFLHSVPDESDRQKNERTAPVIGMSGMPFPKVSHVTQLDDSTIMHKSEYNLIFPLKDRNILTPTFNINELKFVTSLANESSAKTNESVEIVQANVEETLTQIEASCSDAREIWNRISPMVNGDEKKPSPKRKGKKRKSNEKKSDTSLKENTNRGYTWTQKYRPTSAREIVGNEEAVQKLRKWLDGWRAPLRKDEYSSSEEFYSSDCSYVSSADSNKVAVLLGPHGSGKTASVYAVAEELGYSVIEVNASSKRAGKRILKELEEATKSHRIKKPEMASLAPILKEKKAIPQNSLILIEDVDVIFEEDEGFVSATCQLASNTKRPIVMTLRNTCSHLNRMAPEQLRIYYQSTIGPRVSALLELITLAESGYRLPRPCLDRLLQTGDLRKALLQLQYLLLSGKPNAAEVPTNFRQSLWQDMRYHLYKPAIKASKKLQKKKLANSEGVVAGLNNTTVINDLANSLDNLSFVSTLIEIDDRALDLSTVKLEPSLSLDENTHAYSSIHNTNDEIAEWIRDRILNQKGSVASGEGEKQMVRQLSLKRDLTVGVKMALAQVSPQILDNTVLSTDYLSSVRTICRAEESRITGNTKRGNRFFHYLQNLGLPSTSTKPNILAAACKMMQEKNAES